MMPGPKGQKDDASLLVRVRSTEQYVWHQLLTNLNVINARAKSLKARCACTNIKLEENKCV